MSFQFFSELFTVPTPSVSVEDYSAVQLGNASLFCNGSLTNYSQEIYSNESYVSINWTSTTQLELEDETLAATSTVTSTQHINDISITSAGLYFCTAHVFYNGSNSQYVVNSNVSNQAIAQVNVTSEFRVTCVWYK